MDTNANSKLLAVMLEKAHAGFTGLQITKKGTVRGGLVYGDERVWVTLITGFHYDRLVQRSLNVLPDVWATDMITKAAAEGHTITVADVEQARGELIASFERSLAGNNTSDSTATNSHVFEPLVVDGETVRGSKVYHCVKGTRDRNGAYRMCHCRNCTGEPRAALPGTIYLHALKTHSKVLEPAPNGPIPEPNSKPKTIAKNTLRSMLPVSRYVSYVLEPGTGFILAAGGVAKIMAAENGFIATDEVVQIVQQVI